MRAVLRWTWRTLPCSPCVHLSTRSSHTPAAPPLPNHISHILPFSTLHLSHALDDASLPYYALPPSSSFPSQPRSAPSLLPTGQPPASLPSSVILAFARGCVSRGDLASLTSLLTSFRQSSLPKSLRPLYLVQALLRAESKTSALPLLPTRLILEAAKAAGVPIEKDELCHRLHLLAIIRQSKSTDSTARVLDDCLAALAAINSPPPLFSTAVCNLLLYAATLSSSTACVVDLFARMKGLVPPLLPNSLTLSLAVQCFLATKPLSLNAALSVYSEVRQWAGEGVTASNKVVLQLMRSCLASASDRRYEGNCIAFVPLLYADLIEAGRTVDSAHLIALLTAFEEMGLDAEAVKEFDRMEERGVAHSDEVDVIVLLILVRLNDEQRLLALIDAIRLRHRTSASSPPPPLTASLALRYRKALLLSAGKPGQSAQLLPLMSLLFSSPTWCKAVLTAEFNAVLVRVWKQHQPLVRLQQRIDAWRKRAAVKGEKKAWTAWLAAAAMPSHFTVRARRPRTVRRSASRSAATEAREAVYAKLHRLLSLDGPLDQPGSLDPTPFLVPWQNPFPRPSKSRAAARKGGQPPRPPRSFAPRPSPLPPTVQRGPVGERREELYGQSERLLSRDGSLSESGLLDPAPSVVPWPGSAFRTLGQPSLSQVQAPLSSQWKRLMAPRTGRADWWEQRDEERDRERRSSQPGRSHSSNELLPPQAAASPTLSAERAPSTEGRDYRTVFEEAVARLVRTEGAEEDARKNRDGRRRGHRR